MQHGYQPIPTADDYLSAEESSGIRHEYVDGEVYAMAGVSLTQDAVYEDVTFIPNVPIMPVDIA